MLCTRVCACVHSAVLPAQVIFCGLVGDAELAQRSREGLAPARVVSDPTEIPQVHGAVLLTVMPDVALCSFSAVEVTLIKLAFKSV